jgi:hypothetical protein
MNHEPKTAGNRTFSTCWDDPERGGVCLVRNDDGTFQLTQNVSEDTTNQEISTAAEALEVAYRGIHVMALKIAEFDARLRTAVGEIEAIVGEAIIGEIRAATDSDRPYNTTNTIRVAIRLALARLSTALDVEKKEDA